MPDISMCTHSAETCALDKTCYRNEESGTTPTPRRQSYMNYYPFVVDGQTHCNSYDPIMERKTNHPPVTAEEFCR